MHPAAQGHCLPQGRAVDQPAINATHYRLRCWLTGRLAVASPASKNAKGARRTGLPPPAWRRRIPFF